MTRYWQNIGLLAKEETIYGTDATPTGAANAIVASEFTWEEIVGTDVERNVLRPYMGHPGIELTGNYSRLQFSVEMAGSGTAGTAPRWGVLHKSCGMAEIISAGVDVKYKPISGLFSGTSIYFFADGIKYAMLGSRGNWTTSLTPQGIPAWTYTKLGLLAIATDAALPAITEAQPDPVPVNKANTTVSLHGLAGPTEGLTLDYGAQVEARMLINHESIQISARRATGSAVLEAVLLAEKNWRQIAQSKTLGELAVKHGTAAGNIVEIDGDAVQIGRPGMGQTQGIINNTLPLICKPSGAGNNDLIVTVR